MNKDIMNRICKKNIIFCKKNNVRLKKNYKIFKWLIRPKSKI